VEKEDNSTAIVVDSVVWQESRRLVLGKGTAEDEMEL
jgi:hypothetical protein